jgi:hypothetical protein
MNQLNEDPVNAWKNRINKKHQEVKFTDDVTSKNASPQYIHALKNGKKVSTFDRTTGKEKIISGKTLTPSEIEKRNDIVKILNQKKADFKKKYGPDYDNVIYGIATKRALSENFTDKDIPGRVKNQDGTYKYAVPTKGKLELITRLLSKLGKVK